MENYEKKYKEVLELIKDNEPDENGIIHIRPFEIFPELTESEDEKTRKDLVNYFHGAPLEHPEKEVLAWLEKKRYSEFELENEYWRGYDDAEMHIGEKQGEQKTPIWKHWKDGIAGDGEGKLIYLIKYGNTYSLSSCLSFECDYIELLELDKLLSEKQGKQKPIKASYTTIVETGNGDINAVVEKDLFAGGCYVEQKPGRV